MLEVLLVSQVVLLVIVVALGLVVFALARQIGVLYERVAPFGALMTAGAVDIGQTAPSLEVHTLNGRMIEVGGTRETDRNQLLLFVSPTCPMCKKLLSLAKSFARRERRSLDIILIGDGDRDAQQRFVKDHKLEQFPYVISPQLGMTFQVGKLPFAVLIDEDGVVRAKGLVNSREHLESLLVAKETGYASIQEYLIAKGGAGVAEDRVSAAPDVHHVQRDVLEGGSKR